MYGGEAVIHAAIFNLLYSVLIYTYGINRMKTVMPNRSQNTFRQLLTVYHVRCAATAILIGLSLIHIRCV